MTKHTPGPWDVRIPSPVECGYVRIVYIEPNEEGRGAQQIAIADVMDNQHEEANTRLIAAAPDLLAALQDVLGYAEAHEIKLRRTKGGTAAANSVATQIAAARAAITRATGAK